MFRILNEWTGFPGAPGITAFYFTADDSLSEVNAAREACYDFWDDLKGELPSGVTISALPDAEVIDSATGELLDVVSSNTGVRAVTGTTSGTFPAPAGAVVSWFTAGIHAGRRVRGRTFIVPLKGSAYQNDGSLDPFTLAAIQAAAGTFAATPTLSIWCRPRPGVPGAAYGISSSRVPDLVAVLRSRRD